MRNERLMILRMIEEGKISANEGLALLEALEEEGPWPEGAGPREEQGPHGQGSEARAPRRRTTLSRPGKKAAGRRPFRRAGFARRFPRRSRRSTFGASASIPGGWASR